ncbi:MAG: hypothetical protein H6Q04_1707, partial [Acidobacteria bacterium]|nr:hypothetical protein [Acidobacteriota bacterium]
MIRRYLCCVLLIASTVCGVPVTSYSQVAAALPELTFKRLMNDLQIIVAETPDFEDDL